MMEENGLPKGWVETTLGEIALINPRESLKKGTAAVNVPMTSLEPFTKKIQSFEIKEFNGGTKFRNGDTLLARITPCLENGKTAFVDILKENEVGFGSTEYIVIRSKRKCSDKNFLYYLSISPLFREVAKKVMTGTSGRQRVQTDVLINRKFNIPPLPEQKAIASILTSFDDKIELLQAQNETLETIAQTIFKEWFGKYQVGDELPEGWRVGKYQKIVDLSSGKGVKKFEYLDDGKYEIIGANGSLGRLDKFLINEKVIVTGRVGTLGTVFIINKPTWITDNVLISKPKNNKLFYFSYFTLKGLNFTALNTGSTQPLITQGDLKSVEIILPNEILLQSFEKVCSKLFRKIEYNSQQIQTLQATRDTLLPKLMSGQLRVAEFQEQLSEVM